MSGSSSFSKLVNALARFTGGAFVIVGVIFVALGLRHHEVFSAVVGLVVAVLGVLLIIAKSSTQRRKNEPNQTPQPTLTIRPFSIMITPLQPPSAAPGERG